MKIFITIIQFTIIVNFLFSTSISAETNKKLPLKTPLEVTNYKLLPKTHKIELFLKSIAANSEYAKFRELGRTAGGRRMSALLISKHNYFLETGKHKDKNLTVLLIGSLHGTESAGNEALQKFALDLVNGKLSRFLNKINFIIIPNGNPDGRDNMSRFNQVKGNLNVDFIKMNYPETLVYAKVLQAYNPHVTLDLHESSIKKNILSLKQGYYTNFEAQYETANNPNIDSALLNLMQQVLLPELINLSKKNGLAAQHYHGEITKLNQEVNRGGLRLSNFRNYSALQGRVSFLVENRLEPVDGHYLSPHNIKQRIQRQYISVMSLIEVLQKHNEKIVKLVSQAQRVWKEKYFSNKTIKLVVNYNLNIQSPIIEIQLKKIATGDIVRKAFFNFNFIDITKTTLMPGAYAITTSQEKIGDLLKKHFLQYETIKTQKKVIAMVPKIKAITIQHPAHIKFRSIVNVTLEYDIVSTILNIGDLLITTKQKNGLLVPLLLDPRSNDSIYQGLTFRTLLINSKRLNIFPIVLPTQ